jgi:hypothetical protein
MQEHPAFILSGGRRMSNESIPKEEFPEWLPASMRPIFSDEEIVDIETWPVVFSEGSYVYDDADVPF